MKRMSAADGLFLCALTCSAMAIGQGGAVAGTPQLPARMTLVGGGEASRMPAHTEPPSHMVPVGAGYGSVVPPEIPSPLYDNAYRNALRSLLPLDPDQIRQLKRLRAEVEQATATPGGGAPRPVVRSVSVSLAPGTSPPTLHLFPNNVTTLVFSDESGAPWPVTSVTVGNKKLFQAQIVGNLLKGATKGGAKRTPTASNIVTVIPLTDAAAANNLVVTLQGGDIPVIFTLDAGGSAVDYRLDVQVRGRGPDATPDIAGVQTIPDLTEPQTQAFLDGIPPKSAVRLDASDPAVGAWFYDGQMYLRTGRAVLAPAYSERVKSISGATVYVLPPVPVVLVATEGRPRQVTISGFPPSKEQ